MTYLLPVLLSKVNMDPSHFTNHQLVTQAHESRFVSLKIMTDILVYLISEDQVYSPNSMQDKDGKHKSEEARLKNAEKESATQRLNTFLQQGLLPLINQLLQENDPIPFYAQRIISTILDRNSSFVMHLR